MQVKLTIVPPNKPSRIRLVAIGASAGGVEALGSILPALPDDFPCVVIVQHILKGFTAMLAETLDRRCQMKVAVAQGGEFIRTGRIYIAGDGAQLRLRSMDRLFYLSCDESQKIGGHCPAVDALFSSAVPLGDAAIGVILSGMGSDGARGLLAMRGAGAYTIGQSEQSCSVYGMPKAAMEQGAVMRQLPAEAIAAELILRVKRSG